jgi:hypothetical protein
MSYGLLVQRSTSLSINLPIFRGPSANRRNFSAVALAARTVLEPDQWEVRSANVQRGGTISREWRKSISKCVVPV